MAESTTNVKSEKVESQTVANFCDNLANGTSVVQTKNEAPSYMKNVITGNVPQGLAQLSFKQGCYEQGVKGTLFLSYNQAIENNSMPMKGSHSIGSMPIRNVYNKDDKEVIEGKAKAGERKKDKDGNEGPAFHYIYCYAAERTVELKWVPELDENGEARRYSENVYSEDKVYEKDRVYKDKEGNTLYAAKKGEPVILHLAGSIVGHQELTDKRLVPEQPNILPKINDDKELFALPKPRDESAFEVLKCGMAQYFRGIYHGNGEGWHPSNAEIANIRKEFISSPGMFSSAISQADTYGRGNKAECEKMEKAINEKRLQKENTNVNTNVNQNHHKR